MNVRHIEKSEAVRINRDLVSGHRRIRLHAQNMWTVGKRVRQQHGVVVDVSQHHRCRPRIFGWRRRGCQKVFSIRRRGIGTNNVVRRRHRSKIRFHRVRNPVGTARSERRRDKLHLRSAGEGANIWVGLGACNAPKEGNNCRRRRLTLRGIHDVQSPRRQAERVMCLVHVDQRRGKGI